MRPAPRRWPASRRERQCVNRAPPSGQFSTQMRPRSAASRPAGDRQPHPGPGSAHAALRATVEALEDVRQVLRRRCPGPDRARSASAPRPSRPPGRAPDSPAACTGPRSPAHARAPLAVRRGSTRTRRSDSATDRRDVPIQRATNLFARRFDDFGRMHPSEVRAESSRRRCAPSRGCSGTGGRAARPRSSDQRALLAPLLVGRPRRLQVARGHANRRQRRPEIVGERGEQRRLQLLALPRQLRRPCAPRETAPARWQWRRCPRARRASPLRPAGRPTPAGRPALAPKRSGTSRTRRARRRVDAVRCASDVGSSPGRSSSQIEGQRSGNPPAATLRQSHCPAAGRSRRSPARSAGR